MRDAEFYSLKANCINVPSPEGKTTEEFRKELFRGKENWLRLPNGDRLCYLGGVGERLTTTYPHEKAGQVSYRFPFVVIEGGAPQQREKIHLTLGLIRSEPEFDLSLVAVKGTQTPSIEDDSAVVAIPNAIRQ